MRIRVLLICFFLQLIIYDDHACATNDTCYIFQVNQAIEDKLFLDCVEPVREETGIYRTSNISIIQHYITEGTMISYTEDVDVSLFDMQEDIALLNNEDWSHAMLGVDYASKNGLDGTDITIALIDSGIRNDFAQLTGAAVEQGINYLASPDSEEWGNTSDSVGHGTFVASIIVSSEIGLAPKATVVPLKCFDAEKSSVSYVVSAIYTAVDDYQCDIINLSLGTKADNPFLRAAVSYACKHGVIVVAASGNLGNEQTSVGNDALYYPAAYDEVISVGAVDASGRVASFSVQNASVLITAPGDGVRGLSRTGTRYKNGSGTSYASPYVTAAAALAKNADPTLEPQRFMELLRITAEDAGDDGYDDAYGYGILNIGLLLAMARNDCESLILSLRNGSPRVSCYQPDLVADYRILFAFYNADGRFAELPVIRDVSQSYVTNCLMGLQHSPYLPLIVKCLFP